MVFIDLEKVYGFFFWLVERVYDRVPISLFALVMAALTRLIQDKVAWCMPFVNDIVFLVNETRCVENVAVRDKT